MNDRIPQSAFLSDDEDEERDAIVATTRGGDEAPLSYSQQQLWLLQRIAPELTAYNLPRVFRLQGSVDAEALERAFAAVIDRHATLRTRFAERDGMPFQVVMPHADFRLERINLSGQTDRERTLDETIARVNSTVFDLAAPPALAAALITLADDDRVLVACMHHIVSDAWSNPILARDLAQAYRLALQEKKTVRLPRLPVQYTDYAAWQRSRFDNDGFAEDIAYWNGYLGNDVPSLDLPVDRVRPAMQTFAGQAIRFELESALTEAVRTFCRAEKCTPFIVLMAAWQALLSRHCGQADFGVGVPNAGRHREEIQELMGFFVTTQVFRARLSSAMTLRQLCRQVRADALSALSHADLPFEVLLQSRRDKRDAARNPLFQVLFGVQMADGANALAFEGATATPLAFAERGAKFELSLDLTVDGERIDGRLEYNTDLFEARTVKRLIRGYLHVLQTIVTQPERVLGEVTLLEETEKTQLQTWSSNQQDYGAAQAVHEQIEQQSVRTPLAVAVVFGEQQLDYATLNAQANRLAHRLIKLGVKPETKVGIAVERSIEMVVGLLAILKAGAAYVPLDPEYPQDRLQTMMEDSGIALLLTQSHLRDRLPLEEGCPVLLLDTDHFDTEPQHNPAIPVHGDQLAYVIFTSGSTGKPKGAANRHRALSNRLAWMQQAYRLDAGDAVLQKTPFGFDVSVWEFFWPLIEGARLVVAAPGDHRDPARLCELIRHNNITTLHFVPSMLQAFVAHDDITQCRSLKRIVCSGEALPAELQERTLTRLPHVGLYNLYGPTEAAIDVTHWTCRAEGATSVPIGQPIGNVNVRVLDGDLNEVAPGASGELYLGGAGLGRGYLHRPDLTSERFIADPFDAGERLYRTGDLVRWRSDGQLDYLGRIDHQIKLRGFRIELGEIEAQLASDPTVREAVVIAAGGPGGMRLIAYVSAQAGFRIDTEAVRDHLGRVLPDYMVPSAIVVLENLPLNQNGKIDRKALPSPEDVAMERYEAPQRETEIALAAIWADVLRRERVGRTDNFFELGGDSILSLQIVARARQAGWKLTPRQLFELQTVAQLATVAEANGEQKVAAAIPTGAVPLLPIQQAFFERPITARHHWNQSVLLNSEQKLDVEQLRKSLAALVTHHDALRLRYTQSGNQWLQRYADISTAMDDVLWLRQAADTQQITALCEEAQRSLDLQQGPLLRALLIEVADGSRRLLLVVHHLAVDGVSWRVLLEDLQTAYRQSVVGQVIALPQRTGSYQAWAQSLAHYAENHLAESAYWQALSQVPVALPSGTRQAVTARHGHIELALDKARTAALLQEAPAAFHTQVNDILLTALGRALCRWNGSEKIMIDLEGHGREDPDGKIDLSRTTGWFTTLFPVALDATGELGDALMRVKENLRQVPNRGLGFGIFKYMGNAAQQQALRALPQRQVVFNYLGQFDGSFDERSPWLPAHESPGQCTDPDAVPEYAFSINGQVFDGELRLNVGYDAARYAAADVQAWTQDFLHELEALIAYCTSGATGCTASDFPLAQLTQSQLVTLPLQADNLADLYPLSPMQQGMLFHSVFNPQGSAYLNQMRVDVDGLDVARFKAAWQTVLQRHDVLRSGFLNRENQPLQWVARQAEMPMQERDVRGQTDVLLDDIAHAEIGQGFDLAQPPLMRMMLVRTTDETHHLIWTMHHMLLDGWSRAWLLGEVLRCYGGQTLPPVNGRYRDYVGWLQRQDAHAAERYWREQLAKLDEPTRLTDALPKPEHANGYRQHIVMLDESDTAGLNAFARAEHVTVNTIVQAAWALLLGRYCGQRTVCFGATVAGRPAELPGAEQMLGLFINTLPVVTHIRPEQDGASWLRELQAQNLSAREYEHTPLYDIQRWAGQGGQNLFDSIVVFENYPVDEVLQQRAPGGLAFSGVRNYDETSYPLTLIVQQGATLSLNFAYQADRIGQDSVTRIAHHVQKLLHELTAHPQRRLGELSLPAMDELRQLQAWSRNEQDYGVAQAVHEQIEQQSVRTPLAVAVVFGEQQLDYATLNAQANRLAHRLIKLGVQPETKVGIAVERSIEMVLGLLAILKAGAAYVPLDPEYPQDRLQTMMEDSGIALLLTQSHLRDRLPLEEGCPVLLLDADNFDNEPQHNPAIPVHGDQLAYVIFTSGSTGKPKGVAMRHQAVAQLIAWQQDRLPGVYRTLLFASPCFDVSFQEIVSGLANGGGVVQTSNQDRGDLFGIVQLVQDHSIERMFLPFAVLQHFAEAAIALEVRLPHLKQIITAGEQLKLTPALKTWLAQETQCCLVNQYGPTETHVISDFLVTSPYASDLPPIGRPAANAQLHVLDDSLQPVAIGVPGELYAGADALARGYLNRAGLTAKRFIADPLDSKGGRLYRTGDLVRWREDGELDYLGRIDQQVKIRGFRVEPGEIEAQLLRLPGVAAAVVLAKTHVGSKRLLAYVAADAGVSIDVQTLRTQLAQTLPAYMVPDLIMALDALPLNANGKVDRKRLPDIPVQTDDAADEAPVGETEQALAAIWQDVLGIEHVSRHDNFFALGGHSLSLLQVQAKMYLRWQRQLPLQLHFAHPTLIEVAQAIANELQRMAEAETGDLQTMSDLLEALEQ